MNKGNTAKGLTMFSFACFIVLAIAKICGGLPRLSWWWITAPISIPFSVVLLCVVGVWVWIKLFDNR